MFVEGGRGWLLWRRSERPVDRAEGSALHFVWLIACLVARRYCGCLSHRQSWLRVLARRCSANGDSSIGGIFAEPEWLCCIDIAVRAEFVQPAVVSSEPWRDLPISQPGRGRRNAGDVTSRWSSSAVSCSWLWLACKVGLDLFS